MSALTRWTRCKKCGQLLPVRDARGSVCPPCRWYLQLLPTARATDQHAAHAGTPADPSAGSPARTRRLGHPGKSAISRGTLRGGQLPLIPEEMTHG
jgi:hypothetical protein